MAVGPLQRFRLARLVRRAQRGDAKAFSTLFSMLHPTVYGYLAARVRVRADAEDLTADTLHRFVERIGRYDASKGGVRGWVLSIARNALIDHMRKARRHDVAPLADVEHLLVDERFAPDRGDVEPRLQQVRDALVPHAQSPIRVKIKGAAVRQREHGTWPKGNETCDSALGSEMSASAGATPACPVRRDRASANRVAREQGQRDL